MKRMECRRHNRGVRLFFLCLVAIVTAVWGEVFAGAPGTLDQSFSGDGIVITDLLNNDYGADVGAGAGGTVIVAGTRDFHGDNPGFAVVRYLADGSLDISFDSDGIAVTPFADTGTAVYSMAIQDDGKILVAGSSGVYSGSMYITVVRYTDAGALDTTFSVDGIVTEQVGSTYNYANDLAVQEDGKILVAGRSWISDYDFVLLRLNADGSLDSGFGTGGTVTLDLGAWDFCNAVAIQGDGKIILAGRTGTTGSGYDIALARFTSSGTLDASFGSSGIVTTDVVSGQDEIYSLAVQRDGKILGAGMAGGGDLTVVRYDTMGALDTSFDGDGIVINDSCNEARNLVIQPDGRIVVVATQMSGDNQNLAIVRYLSDGSLDPQFGSAGMTVVDLGGDSDEAGGVALQRNGRILVAGSADAATKDFAALRLYGYSPVTVPSQFLLLGD